MNKINLHEKLARIDDHWNPRIVAEFSGMYVQHRYGSNAHRARVDLAAAPAEQ